MIVSNPSWMFFYRFRCWPTEISWMEYVKHREFFYHLHSQPTYIQPFEDCPSKHTSCSEHHAHYYTANLKMLLQVLWSNQKALKHEFLTYHNFTLLQCYCLCCKLQTVTPSYYCLFMFSIQTYRIKYTLYYFYKYMYV